VVAILSYRRFAHRVVVFVFGAVACFVSTPGPAASPGPAVTPEAAVGTIIPHRAIYRLSLLSARSDSTVTDVSGAMMFQWADACDAWTIEQHFNMDFVHGDGEELHVTSNLATWEAKSGTRYRFNVRKTVNGNVDEEIKGQASLDPEGKGGTVHLDKPEASDQPLDAGVLFPTRHSLVLLDRARAGDRFVIRTVLDGTDAEGPTEISAVVGQRVALKGGIGKGVEDKDQPSQEVLMTDAKREVPLLSGSAWPMRLAFFPIKSDNYAPDYEMSMMMLDNGIAESMQLDYGDFTVNAVLETLEPLPKSGC
jgi:hypothetical protein